MKLLITRTDVIHVEPTLGSPLAGASEADQLAAFRASLMHTLAEDDVPTWPVETSDGDWEYEYTDHIAVTVGFVVQDPPKDEEP